MYIATCANILAEALSHNNLPLFFSQLPSADPTPTLASLPLLELLHPDMYWISPHWINQFNTTFSIHWLWQHTRHTYLLQNSSPNFILTKALLKLSFLLLCRYAASLADENLVPRPSSHNYLPCATYKYLLVCLIRMTAPLFIS